MSAHSLLCAFAPEFASSPSLGLALAQADGHVCAAAGSSRDIAVAYLAAHTLAIAERGGLAAGPVTSEREGDLAVAYGGIAGASAGYGSTTYGQQYLATIRNFAMGGVTRAGL